MNIFGGMMKLWYIFWGFITNLDYFLGSFLSFYEYSLNLNLIVIRGE